jgi:hypothetical protein
MITLLQPSTLFAHGSTATSGRRIAQIPEKESLHGFRSRTFALIFDSV